MLFQTIKIHPEKLMGIDVELFSLKCPNCGAIVSKETMKCDYCGADIILESTGKMGSIGTNLCPKCKFENAKGAWFCSNCGNIITTEIGYLRQSQRRIKHWQDLLRKDLPEHLKKTFDIQKEEFLHYVDAKYKHENYVVTEKKFIKFYSPSGIFASKRKEIWALNWDDVNSITSPTLQYNVNVVFCFQSLEKRDFKKITKPIVMGGFQCYQESKIAFENAMHERRDNRAILYYMDDL